MDANDGNGNEIKRPAIPQIDIDKNQASIATSA